jgi:hypothetical protein
LRRVRLQLVRDELLRSGKEANVTAAVASIIRGFFVNQCSSLSQCLDALRRDLGRLQTLELLRQPIARGGSAL